MYGVMPGAWPASAPSSAPASQSSEAPATTAQSSVRTVAEPQAGKKSTSKDENKKRPPPKLVAVFGRTGTGKTTFIESATGQNLGVGHNLSSCTKDVLEVICEIDGQEVVLVDTPGFNDTTLSDVEILTRIAEWMRVTYQEGALLSGIIYLHRIIDVRVEGPEAKNLRMFRSLCGADNLRNVILGTTMWEDLRDEAKGVEREKELKEIFWTDMILKGSRVERVYNQPQWAKNLVRMLLNNNPMATRLQEQISKGRKLKDTDAGFQMTKELSTLEEKLRKEFDARNLETQQALQKGDIETQRELRTELAAVKAKLDLLETQKEVLRDWVPPPPNVLPKNRRRFYQNLWRCLNCDKKTGVHGSWTCPSRSCGLKQRNMW